MDLDKVEIVGVFPNYASAYAAWKSKAQQTVDNAHMRYFIVHLHRLLDPGADGKAQLSRISSFNFRVVSKDHALPMVSARRGFVAAQVLRFVWVTNRISDDPPDLFPQMEARMPAIIAFWHGQHF